MKRERTCLRCNKTFNSVGAWNRICGPCKNDKTWKAHRQSILVLPDPRLTTSRHTPHVGDSNERTQGSAGHDPGV